MKAKFTVWALVITMIASLLPWTVFAGDEVIAKVIYDLSKEEAGSKYSSEGYYYVTVMSDGTAQNLKAVRFRSKAKLNVMEIDGENRLCYMGAAPGTDTYGEFYVNNEHTAVTGGRFVFTGKFYASTSAVNASLSIARKAANKCILSPFSSDGNPVKEKTWYDFKFTIDLENKNNNVRYVFTESNPENSDKPHVLSALGTYTGDSLSFIRLDIDVTNGNTEDFCAYDDVKLTYNSHSAKINMLSNGNSVDSAFNEGIFTASTSGSGLFAIALYKNDQIVKLSAVTSEEELEAVKLNMIIDDMDTVMKVFRFDSDGMPICINKVLSPDTNNYRIYFNETFENGSTKVNFNSTTKVLSDGRVVLTKANTDGTVRFGTFTVSHPDDNIIVEADYELPEGASCFDVKLMAIYTSSPQAIVYMGTGGIRAGASGKLPTVVPKATIESDRKFNVAVKFNIKNNTYDVYYNRTKVTSSPMSLNGIFANGYDGFSVYMPTLESDGQIYVDNIKAYSGTEFADIGDRRQNAHRLDFDKNPNWASEIYERPEAAEIAEKVLETGHPRILINADDIERIKNSTDKRISEWRERVLSLADLHLTQATYKYALSNTGSLGNISESLSMMMNLGLAYQLTGDTRYSDRAYKEAQVLYTVPFIKQNGTAIPEESRDYWNSYSYLDVAEVSYILSICYDWMYDAWTLKQREEISENATEKGLIRDYQVLFGELTPTIKDSAQGWFKSTNNWNAVCNGGVLMSAIAFMETDPYLCGNIAEATIRGFEYFLPDFAPEGAWAEGATYWRYALQYLTAACATLDASCGTDYGISKTPGLENSQFYSLSIEGKTGVVNFGDVSSDHVNAPFMFYWAKKYNNPVIGGAALYIKNQFGFSGNAYDLVYYDPAYVTEDYIPPLSFCYKGTEVVSFASGHNSDDTYIAISGGRGNATSHDHLDSGGIVLEMKGKRLFKDLGAEHYGANGYFSTNRFLFFRARPEAHNIFIINPEITSDVDGSKYYGQYTSAVSEITSYNPTGRSATMNLSDAYARDASSAERTISLDGKKAIIEDSITLLKESNVYWNWYVATSIDKITISEDGKSAVINLDGTLYNVSFETNCDYTLLVQDSDYYVNVDPDPKGSKHSNSATKRLVLKLENATGTVNVKTIVS